MATIYCDPNYRPAELYPQVDALLFFYDQVLLYSPSQDQIERAGLDWRRVKRLIEAGFIVPIGREFWFDRAERSKLSAHHLPSNLDKASTYRWAPLDDAILALPGRGSAATATPGYVVVPDECRRYADGMAKSVPRQRTGEFRALQRRAGELRAGNRLPEELMSGEFVAASPSKLASRLVFYSAGDLRIADTIGAASLFSTAEMGAVYHAVAESFLPRSVPGVGGQITVVDHSKEYKLGKEELQMASRLAKQIVDDPSVGPLDLDLLIEYRQTGCSGLFRDLVSNCLAGSEGGAARSGSGADLKSLFDSQLSWLEGLSDFGPYAVGLSIGAAGQRLLDERFKDKAIGRRAAISVMTTLAFGLFSDRVLPGVSTQLAASLDSHACRCT
jgi:hypothetical protein